MPTINNAPMLTSSERVKASKLKEAHVRQTIAKLDISQLSHRAQHPVHPKQSGIDACAGGGPGRALQTQGRDGNRTGLFVGIRSDDVLASLI